MPTECYFFPGKSRLPLVLRRKDSPDLIPSRLRICHNTASEGPTLFRSPYVMDDTASNENPPKGFNKIDLTQLQGFSFGTQWTQDKSAPREGRRDDRPH